MKALLLTLLLASSFAEASRFVVEANHKLSAKQMAQMKGLTIEAFADIDHPYFSRLYTVSGNISKAELEKRSWVKNIENTIELSRMSLEPGQNPERLVQDELLPYQWSLLNQGQTYVREKDDIHNIPLIGVEGKDIGWKSIYQSLPKGRTIVAVLDSGVDLSHPDLVNNLWKNEKECGKDSSVDNDKNSLPGDCDGWNFTESINSPEAKLPQDMDGHGSHVAGLIAASQNGVGIVGVNPNALIMPIKVMKDSNSKSDIAASESFAKGIIYATNMGAHIINLSLGWPRSLETKHLRDAVGYALSQNVILVAAAGNNNSSEPLFPCAYDGVICAAASTLDGSFAGFSNFGGHVDAITPGEGILSLYPTAFEPEFFSIPGYDIKSGTSQSAPILAGMISILKAQKPDLTINEVYARLYASAQNPDKKKFILGGKATWDSLAKEVDGAVVRPVLKRVRQIVVSGENSNTKLIIPFRNYGLISKNIQVKVESSSAGVEFEDSALALDMLESGDDKDLVFPVRISSFNAESSIQIKVTVSNEEGEYVYLNDIPVVRDVRSEVGFKKSTFSFTGTPIPMGRVEEGKIINFISPISSYSKNSTLQYFTRKMDATTQSAELSVFTRTGSEFKESARKIVIPNYSSMVNFIRQDLNFDGKEDFVLHVVREVEKVKFFEIYFYNSELQPLWSEFPSAKVTIDLLIQKMNDLSFIRMNHATLGDIMVRAFFTVGQIPKIDQKQDFFQRWDGSRESRLYYLEPQIAEKNLRIRTLMTREWKEEVKKAINAKWNDTVLVENILPTSLKDAQEGKVRLIFSVGQSTRRQIFISTFDVSKNLMGKALPQIVLQTEEVDTLLSISKNGLEATGDTYMNVYDRSRVKIVSTQNDAQASQLNYSHVSETDLIVGHIASFEDGNKRLSIIQTRDELISLSTENGQVVRTSRPKLRYSFFSARVLSEMYRPVTYKRDGEQSAALYVDSTAVTANRVYLFEEQAGKLVSSIKNSLVVPANCKAMDPTFSAGSGTHEFVFLCLENKEWAIRTYDMK